MHKFLIFLFVGFFSCCHWLCTFSVCSRFLFHCSFRFSIISEKDELRDISAARQSIEAVSSAIKYIDGHNDPIVTWLNEELLSIREMEYEKLYGPEKQELMEIYQTGDADIDQEFEHELECGLHGKIQAIEEELQQRIKFLNTIRV